MLTTKLTNIAEAIRNKTNTTDKLTLDEMPNKIASIETGGGDVSDYFVTEITDSTIINSFALGKQMKKWPSITLSPTVNTMYSMFNGYTGEELPNINTSHVETLNYAFANAKTITDTSKYNFENVTTANSAYSQCSNLINAPTNYPKLKTADSMFKDCTNLQIEEINAPLLENGYYMFNNCGKLTSHLITDAPYLTNASYMYYGCYKMSGIVPTFNFPEVTNISYMLGYEYEITKVSNQSFPKATSAANFLQRCDALIEVGDINIPLATNISYFFYNSSAIQKIGKITGNSLTNINSAFGGVSALTDFDGIENLGMNYSTSTSANNSSCYLNLTSCKNLTEQSLIKILNNLYDIASKGCKTQKCGIGSDNIAKLTSAEGQAALTNAATKGWTIA